MYKCLFANPAIPTAIKIHSLAGKLLTITTILLLAACGGSNSGGDSSPSYGIGGGISGLDAAGLVLQNNAGDYLIVAGNAYSFQFATRIAFGGNYSVTVAAQPAGQICTVNNGSGNDVRAEVTNIGVVCSAVHAISFSGAHLSVSPSSPQSVVSGGSLSLTVTADTNYTISRTVGGTCAAGAWAGNIYTTGVITADCAVSFSATINTVGGASNTVGGSISGISGTVILINNGTDNLSTSSNGVFAFSVSLPEGSAYNVTVGAQPAGQTCDVSNGSGTIGGSNVTNVAVACSLNTFTVAVSHGGNGSISPNGSVVVAEGGSQMFTAVPSTQYVVNQWLLDGSLVQTGGTTYTLANVTASHTVAVTFDQTTLTPSVASLALSVNCSSAGGSCVYSNAALTGNPRQLTIINNGSVRAANVSVIPTGLPSGTTISSSTCSGTLNAGSSCTITITPGQVATSDCTSGSVPTNGSVTVSSDDAASNVIDVVVLSYGCQYQSGYLYSVDDLYADFPESNSIGGKVASVSDNSAGIYWDASTDCVSNNTCYTTNAESGIDGSNVQAPPGNTYLIYQALTTANPPAESASSYAAGLCTTYAGGGYSDWHLPAVCEMGYGANSSLYFNCGTQLNPLLQNMQSNLAANNIGNLIGGGASGGYYWSSTEDGQSPAQYAWSQYFAASGGSIQDFNTKGYQLGVRCSRALSN